ncbi:MAG TPA: hypothetical protein VHB49_19365 [Bradyrhizobium sp.]|nr:hypothetical protein [Bradyrhizobium sp.]
MEKKTRRRFKQTISLGDRLAEEAKSLRKQAQGTPPGIQREKLIRRARQLDAASHLNDWISSSGMKPST